MYPEHPVGSEVVFRLEYKEIRKGTRATVLAVTGHGFSRTLRMHNPQKSIVKDVPICCYDDVPIERPPPVVHAPPPQEKQIPEGAPLPSPPKQAGTIAVVPVVVFDEKRNRFLQILQKVGILS